MIDVTINKLNNSYLKIECSRAISHELRDNFSYYVDNYQHNPKYKNGYWNGKDVLYDVDKNQIYVGLLDDVIEFCREKNYRYCVTFEQTTNQFTNQHLDQFCSEINLPERFVLHQAQRDSILSIIENKRRLIVSPTGSGKSLIAYICSRYIFNTTNKPILIIVPFTNLVDQLINDFEEYNSDFVPTDYRKQKNIDESKVVITTSRSVYTNTPSFFNKFSCIIGDEAHRFTAQTMKAIMNKSTDVGYRIGMTGSLQSSDHHKMTLKGLFGNIEQYVTTIELINVDFLSEIEVHCIVLNYSDEVNQQYKKFVREKNIKSRVEYFQRERTFLSNLEKRNTFLAQLALAMKGNNVIMFAIKDHGKKIFNSLNQIKNEKDDMTPSFYVDGGVKAAARNKIRQDIDKAEKSQTVSSLGTFATGVNIKNIDAIILATPSKSETTIPQMVGRGLRKGRRGRFVLYDISDSFNPKAAPSASLRHQKQRIKWYKQQGFKVTVSQINMK